MTLMIILLISAHLLYFQLFISSLPFPSGLTGRRSWDICMFGSSRIWLCLTANKGFLLLSADSAEFTLLLHVLPLCPLFATLFSFQKEIILHKIIKVIRFTSDRVETPSLYPHSALPNPWEATFPPLTEFFLHPTVSRREHSSVKQVF